MATNQEGKHASFRAISGTSGDYNSDWLAAAIAQGATSTNLNEAIIEWLQIRIPSSNSNINELLQEYAEALGFDSWDDVNEIPSDLYFEFTVKTDNTGTSNSDQFTVPTVASGTYDCVVDWGDDSDDDEITTYNDSAWTHTFSGGAGTYTVRIRGTFKGLKFNNGGDKSKLIDISQWGIFNSGNQTFAFYGCDNLDITATDPMDLTGVTTIVGTFRNCSSLVYNSSINNWDVSGVTSFNSMFNSCSLFNQSLNGWNTASLTDLGSAFNNAGSLNQSFSNWDTSGVTNMNFTFNNTSMDQDLSNWDFSSVTTATSFLNNTTLSTANYNALLISIEGQAVQSGVTFSGGNATYSGADAAEARFNLVNTSSWTITDGGSVSSFEFDVKTDNTGVSSSNQFTYPTQTVSYDCLVEWGDGTADRIDDSAAAEWTHTYSVAGTYSIKITGNCSRIRFDNGGDKDKILDISRWSDELQFSSSGHFYGCSNLTVSATETKSLGTFAGNSMFRNCTSLTSIPNLNSWDVSSVSSFNSMFRSTALDQDLSSWDTSGAGTFNDMFRDNTAFDQDIGSWDVTGVTSATNMFNGATLSTANYDALLVGWEGQAVQNNVTFHGGNSTYTGAGAGGTARAALIADHTWTITDGGAV